MKQSQKIVLYTATLITAKSVIPAKAGIQKNTGFRVKPGMTNYIRLMSLCITLTFIAPFILFGIPLIDPMMASGQSRGKTGLSQERGRDPFRLPEGIRLLSKINAVQEAKGTTSKSEAKPTDISPPPLKVKAILISDHVRLALIDRHIVTVGDSIHDEKVLEINADRVLLGKGDQKRTLLLSQSPVLLTIEERKGEKR
jgi:hypothetical protein